MCTDASINFLKSYIIPNLMQMAIVNSLSNNETRILDCSKMFLCINYYKLIFKFTMLNQFNFEFIA